MPTERLAKRLAAQLPCSRQQAEQYIVGGWVWVDGAVVQEPMARVHAGQAVVLDAKAKLGVVGAVTLLWHKPAGQDVDVGQTWLPDAVANELFALTNRFKGDRSGVRVLMAHRHKLRAVAALPAQMSGLMVLTQDAGVFEKIANTASQIEHEWLVQVAPDPALAQQARREAVLHALAGPLFFDGRLVSRARASWQSELHLRLAIKGYLPEQVAYLCQRAGVALVAVRRLRVGRMALAGLPVGQWRYLMPYERF